MSNHAKTILRRVLGGIILVIALGLIFNRPIQNAIVGHWQPRVDRQTVQRNKNKAGNYNYNDAKQLSWGTIMAARRNAKNLPVVGVIAIPQDSVYLPIAKGVSNQTLALAAGTMSPTQAMGQGNYALAGHNMANHSPILFSPLYDNAKPGQKVYLTDFDHVYEYKFTSRQIVDPHDMGVLNSTQKPTITLITCNETGSMRLIMKGKLVHKYDYVRAPKAAKKALSHPYNQK